MNVIGHSSWHLPHQTPHVNTKQFFAMYCSLSTTTKTDRGTCSYTHDLAVAIAIAIIAIAIGACLYCVQLQAIG